MRIRLSDPAQLRELCVFFRSVHGVPRVEGETVVVELAGEPRPSDGRQLRAYLATWLTLSAASGNRLEATIEDD